MEITIERVYKKSGSLVVEVDHKYGNEKLGLSQDSLKIDPETGEPRWKAETRRLLEQEYGDVLEDESSSAFHEDKVDDPDIGKKIDLEDLPEKEF